MGGIFLDATTRFYLNMLRAAQDTAMGRLKNKGSAGSFQQAIENAAAAGEGVYSASGVIRTYSTADMTMEEYKQYIYDQIIKMPVDYSQIQDAVSITISEEGFKAMKADPEYEKWVLDTIRRDLSAYYPWGTVGESTYRSHYFGATKKEYRGYCFAKDNRAKRLAEQRQAQIAEQEKRKKRHREYLLLLEKLWLKREREQDYLDEIAKCRREIQSRMLQCYAIERATGEEQELGINPCVLSKAATEYAQNYTFLKLPMHGLGKKM